MHFQGRRNFLRKSVAVLTAGTGGLILPTAATATEPSGGLGSYARHVTPVSAPIGIGKPVLPAKFQPTEDNIWGPYFRKGAPFRAKVTPPAEPGTPLVVRGRVWGQGASA